MGTAWLADMRQSAKYNGSHTFMLAGRGHGGTTVAIVSNVDRLHGPSRDKLESELSFEIATVSQSRVIITGMREAVSDEGHRALDAVIRRQPGAPQVQRTISEVIAVAATSPKARGSIGQSSFTYSVGEGGDELGYLHGDVSGSFNPVVIQCETDMSSLIKSLFGSNVQIVPVSAASISSKQPREIESCKPSIEYSSKDETYKIIELPNFGVLTGRPYAINASGQIVGECWKQTQGLPEATIWDAAGGVRSIFNSHNHSYANDINDEGLVVGTTAIDGGAMRAFVSSHNKVHILETLGGMHGHGNAINNSGVVVGSSWTIPGNTPGDKRERAFIRTPDGELRELGAMRPDWCSRPTDINDNGVVIGMSMSGELPLNRTYAFIWTSSRGMEDLGALTGSGAAALAINAHSIVVGLSGADSFIWSRDSGMRAAPLPPGSKICSINDRGDMAYNRDTQRGVRSFVWIDGVGEIALPTYRDHQSEASFINDQRCVLGHMWAGRHSHAIKWTPKPVGRLSAA
jgi:probable HAF family extracellular repeat protein